MSKYLILAVVLCVCAASIGCRSSAGNCWTRNGSRVPTTAAQPTGQPYPMEEVIYNHNAAPSYMNACVPNACVPNACVPNACVPVACAPAPNACDPCGTANCVGNTSVGYPQQILPGR